MASAKQYCKRHCDSEQWKNPEEHERWNRRTGESNHSHRWVQANFKELAYIRGDSKAENAFNLV